jgi:hypothetical protein
MSKDYMLTTFDNPYNPFDYFTLWQMFDKEKGYDSCERLMRLANIEEGMTQLEIDTEVDRAMTVLISNDFTNTFERVTEDDFDGMTCRKKSQQAMQPM